MSFDDCISGYLSGMDEAELIALKAERAWRRLSRSKSARPEDRAAYRQAARAIHGVVRDIRAARKGK